MDKVDSSAASLLSTLQPSLKSGAEVQGFPLSAKKTKAKGQLRSSRESLFSDFLANSAQTAGELGPLRELAPSEEALTELMDALHSAGSDLKDRPFTEEILRYKKAVRDFVHYVVENGYELQKVEGIKKKTVFRGEIKWKEAVYYQVRVIDQKLEELAAAILSGQTDQLERIAKLDEITGLLVDLTISGVIKERDE